MAAPSATLSIVVSTPYSTVFKFDNIAGGHANLQAVGVAAADLVPLSTLHEGPLKALLTKTSDWSSLQTDPRIVVRRVYAKDGAATQDPVTGASAYDVGVIFVPVSPGAIEFVNGDTTVAAYIEIRFVHSSQR